MRMKRIHEAMQRMLAGLVCLCMTMSMVGSMGLPAFAEASGSSGEGSTTATPQPGYTEHILVDTRKSDPDTMDTYLDRLLNQTDGSRYAGRVWTDKSVFAYGYAAADSNNPDKSKHFVSSTVEDEEGNEQVVYDTLKLDMLTDGYNGYLKFNADFLHVFSALASSQVVNEYPPSPIDLVIVFDMSGSMGQDTRFGIDAGGGYHVAHVKENDKDSNGKELTGDAAWPEAGVPMKDRIESSRVQATLTAINETIDALMAQNPQNRVAVCGYGANAVVLMPLGHYKRNGKADYLSVGGMETLYHPSDLVYKTKNEDHVSEDGWYWQNNRDTCYTVVVNAKYNTYTGILNNNGDGKGQEGANGGTDEWTKITKTVSNNVLDSEGQPVKAFPGVADQSKETDNEANRQKSHDIYAAFKANAEDTTYAANSENLKTSMANTQGLKADDYVGYFTNTQGGIYLAYKQLADSADTTYTEKLSNGVVSTVARIPAAIIMSDGGANFAFNEMGGDSEEYTVNDWNTRYGQIFYDDDKNKTENYISDDAYTENHTSKWIANEGKTTSGRTLVDGRPKDYSHRLDNDENRNVGDEWYNVYLPGNDTLDHDTTPNDNDKGYWNGLHGIYNQGADMSEDGTLSTQPAWNHAGVLYSNDNNIMGTSSIIMEILLTASYMSDVVQAHYSGGWTENNATQDSRIDLSTYTMNVDTVHVPLWGRMRLYPTLDPATYDINDIESWYEKVCKPDELSKFITDNYSDFASLLSPHVTSKAIYVDGYSSTTDNHPGFAGLKQAWETWKNGDNTVATVISSVILENSRTDIRLNSLKGNEADYKTQLAKKDGTVVSQVINVSQQDVINNIAYNDMFYDVESKELSNIFDEILTLILGKVFVPVSGDNDAGVGDSITYQDPLGEYMEIKNQSITATLHDEGAAGTYDMSMLLFGEMHGLVRAGVYDYNWNDTYVKNENGGESGAPFEEGWYKGTPEPTNTEVGNKDVKYEETMPPECSSAVEAWAAGWVYRLSYSSLTKFVPIVNDVNNPGQLTEQAKNTVYTIYRFSGDSSERNALRRNPIYGTEIPADVTKNWNNYYSSHNAYPDNNEIYSGTPGVYRLSDIRVWVEETGDFVDQDGAFTPETGYDRALYVNIPAAAVPTELATITLGKDGVLSYKTNLGSDHEFGKAFEVGEEGQSVPITEDQYKNYCAQSTPFRLFYAVGLEEDLILRDEHNNQTGVNVAALSEEYVSSHTDENTNSIWFISNYYSKTNYNGYVIGGGINPTRGDPTVTFSPSTDNRYYVFQKPLALYAHAYRVQSDGNLARVDGSKVHNGDKDNIWENYKGAQQTAASWAGGEFMGIFTDKNSFDRAYAAAVASKGRITDDTGINYPVVDNGIVFLQSDLLSDVTEVSDVTEGNSNAKSFSSNDYYFILIEYYQPTEGVGKNNEEKDVPGTSSGKAVKWAVARKGSDFGSGFDSDKIENGDMLCWTDTADHLTLANDIVYLSYSETGDKTRGMPTFEKLTYESGDLTTYLNGIGDPKKPLSSVEITVRNASGDKEKMTVLEYWLNLQKNEFVQAAIEAAKHAPGSNDDDTLSKDEFNDYFKFAVAARPGGIRSGNMANNVQGKAAIMTAPTTKRT